MSDKPKRLLFLCTGNSCRSQMAEGFARTMAPKGWVIESAGLEPHGVNPRAVRAMTEVGIDISHHTSDELDPEKLPTYDVIITLCGDANERCPITPPSVRRIHWPFPDPARATGTEEEIMEHFREVRDGIRRKVEEFFREG